MAKHIELNFVDASVILGPAAFCFGLVLSGAIEQGRVEQAWRTLGTAWPVLGATVCRNGQIDKLEMVIPDTGSVELKATSLTLDQTLAETESLFIRTPTISTQVTTPSTHLYRTCPLQTLKDLADSGDPIWSLHVTYLKDSTIIGLTFPHVMDARGYQTLLTGLMQALADQPIPSLLSYDPWLKILPEALKSSVQVGAAWNVESIQEMQRDIVADIEATGPMQTRIVYFPAEEVTRLKQQAMADIRKAGYTDVQWVSTSDVLSAWFYQHAFLDLPSNELATRFLCNIDSRKYFPEIFPSSSGYLQNSFFTIATEPQFTVKQLHNMTFGEITRAIHLLVKSYALRKPLMGILKGFHENQRDFYISFSPGGHLQGVSSWLSFDFGSFNFAKYVKPGSGSGKVLEITAEGIGKPHGAAYIKFKDSQGGVVCEMSRGAKFWTSGTMAKYAFETV